MAIDPSSASKSTVSVSAKKDNKKIKNPKSKNGEEDEPTKGVAKRKTNPGIRVVGGRIYDSENGKSCHQCRQKTTDFFAPCRNQNNNKACSIAYCHKCLLNRYGEKAEEVTKLEDWSCPKCKGVCNCSQCMKKRGHQPTGILAHTAKAKGFSSVSDMLQTNEPAVSSREKLVTDMGASPRKRAAQEMDNGIITSTKLGKENSFTGKVDSNLFPVPPLDSVSEKANKAKLKGSGKRHHDEGASEADANPSVKRRMVEGKGKKDIGNPLLEPAAISDDKKLKKPKKDKVNGMMDDTLLRRTSPRKHTPSKETLTINGTRGTKANALSESKILEGQESQTIDHPKQNPDQKKQPNLKKSRLNHMHDGTLVKRTSPRKLKQLNETVNENPVLNMPSKETLKINGTDAAKANALSESEILEGQESKPIGHPKQNPKQKKQQHLKKGTLKNQMHDDTLVKRTSPRKLNQLNETVKENPVLNTPSKEALKINGTGGAKANALSESKISEGQESKPIDHQKENPGQKKQLNLKKSKLNHMHDGTLAKRTSPRKLQQANETVKENPVLNACKPGKETVKTSSLVPSNLENMKKLDDHDTQSNATGEFTQINMVYQCVRYIRTDIKLPQGVELTSIDGTDIPPDVKLPQGVELTSIDGTDIPPEDIGKALQFLEFCAAFGKVLDVKKGQAESVLKDLLHGRTSRRGKYSATVQFHIHLISIIQEEQEMSVDINSSNGKQLWVQALKECFSESECVLRSLALDQLSKKADAYDSLTSSEKLQILNVLCDEVLGTAKIRNWFDDQITKHSDRAKEQKEKVADARNKEKALKQKVQNEIAKAIIEKTGSGLSISEHGAIISQIKSEAAQAHSELLESEGLLTKINQAPDALRIEPEYVGSDGRVYWRLKSLSKKSDIVVQDVGSDGISMCNEKWYSFDEEQKEAIQKSIIVLRSNKVRAENIRKRQRCRNNEPAPKPVDDVPQ